MAWLDRGDGLLFHDRAGAGPPVLMIQGVGCLGVTWRPQIDALSPRFEVAWFDHRGVGQSPRGTGPVSIEAMAEDSLALLDALGWHDAHVVGHSMGGVIAQELALRARGRVRSLSLLCTLPRGRDATRLSAALAWIGLRMQIGTRASRRRAFLEIVLPRHRREGADLDALARDVGEVFGRDLADPPGVTFAQTRALGRHDASARLGELEGIPTLVVSAVEDLIAPPPRGRALAAAIPGARYVELDRAAHGVPVHDPGLVDTLLLEHLAGVEARRTAA